MKLILAIAAAALGASAAESTTLSFRLSGDASYTFRIDEARIPDRFVPGAEADFYDVPGRFGAVTLADAYFYTASTGGGLSLRDFAGGSGLLLDALGPQLFTGPTSSPRLSTGEFDLVGQSSDLYHLSVTAIPEPGQWALMTVGFALAGGLLRRRRGTAVTA